MMTDHPDAVALTELIRESYDPALLAEAYTTHVHEQLGYSVWRDYAAERLAPAEKLPRELRQPAVRALHEAGASQRDMAAALGVRQATIYDDRQRLGLKCESPTAPQAAGIEFDVEQLAAEGLTADEIAERLHVGRRHITNIAGRIGLILADVNSRISRERRLEALRQGAASGLSSRQLAVDLGITEARVRELARRNGIAIPADAYVLRRARLDHTRIVRSAVADTFGIGHLLDSVDWEQVDLTDAAEWTAQLGTAIRQLTALRQRITKEAANRDTAERATVTDDQP